jgi:predicted RND superfamily exporter protein
LIRKKSAEILGTSEIVYVITEDEGRIKEKELMEKIKRIPAVESVLGLSEQLDMAIPESFIPDEVADRFINGNYRYFQVMLSTSSDDPDTFSAIDKIRELAQDTFNEYYVTGSAPLSRDLAGLVDMDSRNVAIISVGLIAIILAFSFMSLSIPFILILIIELAIWINLSIPYFQGNTVSSVTSIVIGAIQLGATVDYAILFTTRYRENLGLIPNKKEALRQTIEDTGRTILTSALTMLSATLGIALIASIKTTGELTMMIGRGAIISMVTIFLGLPPMLLIFDRLIGWTTKNWVKTTVKGGNFSEKKNI